MAGRSIATYSSFDKFFNFIFTYFSYIFSAGHLTHTEHPATTRIESTSEEVQGDLSHGPAETRKKHLRNDDNVDVQGNLSHDLPEWLQEFRYGRWMKVFQLTGTHPRVLLVNYLQSREPKWYRVSFPKDRNCDIFLRTKVTRASCRKRTGTIVSGGEHFGDLITADHKVLREGCESRNNHRCAVVVQDLVDTKQKLLRKRRRACKSSWSRRGTPK